MSRGAEAMADRKLAAASFTSDGVRVNFTKPAAVASLPLQSAEFLALKARRSKQRRALSQSYCSIPGSVLFS